MKCKKGLEVKPLSSFAGWYMGTFDEDGPRGRLTTRYARTTEEARYLEIDREQAEENCFCHGGGGCGFRFTV